MPAAERVIARALVVAVLVVVPLQDRLQARVGKVYPTLTYPAFANSPASSTTFVSLVPRLDTTFVDGTTRTYEHTELLADLTLLPVNLMIVGFRKGLDDDGQPVAGAVDRAHDVRTRRWLRDRLRALAGREPASVTVRWTRESRRLPGGHLVVAPVDVQRVVLDLGSL